MLEIGILIFLITVAGLLLLFFYRSAPKPFTDPPRPVLICAAHSDDCVIMGAEYALGAIEAGHPVSIVYMTCSGPSPAASISNIRKAEARTAWGGLGVPAENLTFLDIGESPVSGPPNYSKQEIDRAAATLGDIIRLLPTNAAVIISAAGEDHIDHNTFRDMALDAVSASERLDLIIYETPEYNNFLSLALCPMKTLHAISHHIPFMNRILPAYRGPANFASGSPGFIFRDSHLRLSKKQELLSFFKSQDINLVMSAFAHASRYRSTNPKIAAAAKHPFSVQAFGSQCDVTVIVFGFAVLLVAFCATYVSAEAAIGILPDTLPSATITAVVSIGIASFYFIRRLRRTISLETLAFVLAATLGLFAGAL